MPNGTCDDGCPRAAVGGLDGSKLRLGRGDKDVAEVRRFRVMSFRAAAAPPEAPVAAWVLSSIVYTTMVNSE